MTARSHAAIRPLPVSSVLLVLLALGPSCATPGGPPMDEIASALNQTLVPNEVVLAPGDTLEVRAFRTEDFDQDGVTVQTDGYANFLLLDQVRVAGLTLEQLDRTLTSAYRPFLRADLVDEFDLSVRMAARGPRTITVLGEVGSPGQFVIDTNKHLTFLEALSLAGGPREGSGYMASTLLVRWDAVNQEQHAWVFDARNTTWQGREPLFLQPYDLVYVPAKPIVNVGTWINQHIRGLLPFPTLIPN